MCVCACACVHVCVCARAHTPMSTGADRHQRHRIPLKLELQEVTNCQMWVLGIEFTSFARAGFTLENNTMPNGPII